MSQYTRKWSGVEVKGGYLGAEGDCILQRESVRLDHVGLRPGCLSRQDLGKDVLRSGFLMCF